MEYLERVLSNLKSELTALSHPPVAMIEQLLECARSYAGTPRARVLAFNEVQYPAFSKAQEIFTSLRILSPGYVPLFVRTIGGIDGHRIALELSGKVRGLPELDEAYLGPSY